MEQLRKLAHLWYALGSYCTSDAWGIVLAQSLESCKEDQLFLGSPYGCANLFREKLYRNVRNEASGGAVDVFIEEGTVGVIVVALKMGLDVLAVVQ